MLKIEALARSSLSNKKRANNSYGRPGLETNDIAVYFESPATNRTRFHVFIARHLVPLTDYVYRQEVIAEREIDFSCQEINFTCDFITH